MIAHECDYLAVSRCIMLCYITYIIILLIYKNIVLFRYLVHRGIVIILEHKYNIFYLMYVMLNTYIHNNICYLCYVVNTTRIGYIFLQLYCTQA